MRKGFLIFILVVFVLGGTYFALSYKPKIKKVKQINTDEKKKVEVNTTGPVKEEKKEHTVINQEGEEVKITANKTISATGFAGASNHVFYLDGTDLYYTNLANNTKELIATGVTDIYLDGEDVMANLGAGGKILKENDYISYNK
ncbi:MAG: hypothetical protein PUA73_02905 [Bacilli bacterium]|nr:hypothetical protein [Bacilli bacterium]